jgi:hypothetical protein
MTEQQFIMQKEAQRVQCLNAAVETILRLGVRKPQMEKARNIYRSIKCDRNNPKDKKQLWRTLGKLLSINDIKFDLCDDNSVYVKSVSSIKIKGDEANGLSVDCLHSFCAKLGMRRTGHLKKRNW